MAADKTYLQKHGNQWRVVVKVPERLREIVGKAHLMHPLHTDNLTTANRDKFNIVAQMKAQLAEAERRLKQKASTLGDPLMDEAMEWRDAPAGDDDNAEAASLLLIERAEEIEDQEGHERAKAFADAARGVATPLLTMVDVWLAERIMKPRQVIDYRRAVTKFNAWLANNKKPTTLEGVSRRIAGSYITEAFVRAGVNTRTANKDISSLSSFWKWAERKGIVEANVWQGQSLAKQQTPKGLDKRPFTDAEMKALFTGNASPILRDFMSIAALSGMRIDEIAKLRVRDIVNDCFDIVEAKTTAGVRMVPIHSGLKGIVGQRMTGKAGDDWLFPELPEPKPGSAVERSQYVVKAFTTYRRRVKVNDVPPGARQSRVDFHSFRRWFITKAEQAHQPPHFISALVGHKREGMTLGRYSAGPEVEQFRAVVEAVHFL